MTAIETATSSISVKSPVDSHSHAAAPARSLSLDGLRGWAVLMVLGFHTGFPGTQIGWIGVDIFFVLSGFLITSILASEFRKNNAVNLAKFWGRRFLRLMPVYWLYAGFITICILWLDRSSTQTVQGWSPQAYVLSLWGYFVNYAPMEGIWDKQKLSIHLWSLAVEEQFYFVWPILAALLFRNFKRPSIFAWIVLIAITIIRLFMPHDHLAHTLYTRGNGIVLGSACALALYDGSFNRLVQFFQHVWARRIWFAATIFMLASVTWLRMKGGYSESGIHAHFQPIFCILFAGIVLILWNHPQSQSARILSFRPLAYLGQISYGVYLYHMIAQYLVWEVFLKNFTPASQYLKYGVRFSAFLLLTIAIATASYYFIEKPFLKLKELLR